MTALPNNGMHPTADTPAFIFLQALGAAGDAGRYAARELNYMKRRVLAISAFAAIHFAACIILALTYLSIPAKERLGIELPDRLNGWLLAVLSFPVRNCVNYFKDYRDQWLYESIGLLVLAGSSILWGIALYYLVAWVKAHVVRHNKSLEMTPR